MPSKLTHRHCQHAYTHVYIHTCTERGQCFSDEKPVCLFHIPLVPGATSEGRGSTQTFLQDADVRIKSQTDSCTQRGRKRAQEKRGRAQRKAKNFTLAATRERETEREGPDSFLKTSFQKVSNLLQTKASSAALCSHLHL